jgi:hypothetical protein
MIREHTLQLLHDGFLFRSFFDLEDGGRLAPPRRWLIFNGLHGKKNVTSPYRPDRLWGPPNLL